MDKFSRSIDDYPDGIVLPVDKPYRWTSADVIRKVKYAAIRHFGKKNLKSGATGKKIPQPKRYKIPTRSKLRGPEEFFSGFRKNF